MKYKGHLPTEQYGFLEIEGDSAEEVMAEYITIGRKLKCQEVGLEPKEWRLVLDRYLSTGEMEADRYAEMNSDQLFVTQEIKKSFKRQQNKLDN